MSHVIPWIRKHKAVSISIATLLVLAIVATIVVFYGLSHNTNFSIKESKVESVEITYDDAKFDTNAPNFDITFHLSDNSTEEYSLRAYNLEDIHHITDVLSSDEVLKQIK